jgi:gas vesicle protein
MPAGKAIAIAAMPTAVLMGMGFTPTLALADGNDAAPPSNSLTADEYKDCVAALEDAEKDPSASPTPSPSATDGADDGKDDAKEPDPSASTGDTGEDAGTDAGSDQDDPSSPDSGSDDKGAEDERDAPAPSPSASQSQEASGSSAAEPSPSESEDKGGLLDGLGDTLEGIFTGGKKAEESPSPTPTPSASEGASDALKETTDTVTDTAKDTVEGATGTASKAAEDTADTVDKAAEAARKAAEKAKEDAEKAKEDATATPSPSASESADEAGKDAEDCPAATDAEGGVDNKLPLPDEPWYLNASSLLLKGASYKGVVEVRTANGTTKKVLKYVISNGTDIGDLHQTVKDEQAGKTYHVQAAKGSTSTIRDGETVMYTESISGNLLGLIPITFDPENPPPLDIPLIYFTKVTVVQAGQFGGTLHVPGLHQYTTD